MNENKIKMLMYEASQVGLSVEVSDTGLLDVYRGDWRIGSFDEFFPAECFVRGYKAGYNQGREDA